MMSMKRNRVVGKCHAVIEEGLAVNPHVWREAHALVVSYLGVRRAIGLIGLLLPILLGPVGYWGFGIPIQDNMSSYYHTALRDEFVGALCAIAIFLFCYRGYDRVESWTANLGCLSALGVALCPIDAGRDPLHQRSLLGALHTASGGLFFFTLAFYSLFHFPRQSRETVPHQGERSLIYRTSGITILLSLAGMGTFLFLLPADLRQRLNAYHFVFWGEWIAVWAFAAAWLTKGRAMLAEIAVELLAIPTQFLQKRE